MPLPINGSLIETVRIVDDKPERRRTMARDLAYLDVLPSPLNEQTAGLDLFLERVMEGAQAATTDQEMGNYAPCRGAELTKLCYHKGFPVVLVTRFKEIIQDIRPYRRWIPVLLHPNQADPDQLARAFEVCYHELHGNVEPARRPWPAYVQIEQVDRGAGRASAIIPAWRPPEDGDEEGVQIFESMFTPEVWANVKDGDTLMAQVNLGAQEHSDLFVTEIQIIDRPVQVAVG